MARPDEKFITFDTFNTFITFGRMDRHPNSLHKTVDHLVDPVSASRAGCPVGSD